MTPPVRRISNEEGSYNYGQDNLFERITPSKPARRSSAFGYPSVDVDHNRHDGHRIRIRDVNYRNRSSQVAEGQGNWKHLKHKDARCGLEQKTQAYDPYSHIDVATRCETFFYGQATRQFAEESEHFAYIVDLDNYEYHKVIFHSFLAAILQSSFFRYGILFLVFLNAVLIGIQTFEFFNQYKLILQIIDYIILSVFMFEIVIKWIYDFRLFWCTVWNCLDFVIVALTVLAAVIPTTPSYEFYFNLVSKGVKVVRVCRSLRCVSSMSSLRVVSLTVIKSVLDLASILIVLLIVMVVLSVMAVTLFDDRDIQDQKFLNVLDAWFVVFICVTQDGWAQLLNDFKDKNNQLNFVLIAVFLIICVCLGAFVFANLIVAVIVSNLELSVNQMVEETKLDTNPLDLDTEKEDDVDLIPMYELLSKNIYNLAAQRPIHVAHPKKNSSRELKVYLSLIAALEQNMLEAEIITVDLEKIMAVLVSISSNLDVTTGKIAEKERKADLEVLKRLAAGKGPRGTQESMSVRLSENLSQRKASITGRLRKQSAGSKRNSHVLFAKPEEEKDKK